MVTCEQPPAIAGDCSLVIWPAEDSLRLLCFLQACGSVPLLVACQATRQRYGELVTAQRKAEKNPERFQAELEMQGVATELEQALAGAKGFFPDAEGNVAATARLQRGITELTILERELTTERWYVYGPDWELQPGRLISRKGTWLKHHTGFSWELTEEERLYIPHGLSMPILQLGDVKDLTELKRHDWAFQHRLVWLAPQIIRDLEARRGTWFIFWPHWSGTINNDLVATSDTFLKRSCQMSGELGSFEMVYVAKGFPLRIKGEPESVEEEWEKNRHPHVHQHRKVVLTLPPSTVKQDKFDIFVGQFESENQPLL